MVNSQNFFSFWLSKKRFLDCESENRGPEKIGSILRAPGLKAFLITIDQIDQEESENRGLETLWYIFKA